MLIFTWYKTVQLTAAKTQISSPKTAEEHKSPLPGDLPLTYVPTYPPPAPGSANRTKISEDGSCFSFRSALCQQINATTRHSLIADGIAECADLCGHIL